MAAELRRILYVEDEPDIRTVAEMALETLGGTRSFCVPAERKGCSVRLRSDRI
ncbi:hypothetical protein AAIA72_07315 [Hahella sp. SMD15-11]|uniref:Response regulator n=1 Tax=Thermohahella caldifontis TaxID=3142973 RepID=A0AB39V046_9GAMM